jgi:hypothetical protein
MLGAPHIRLTPEQDKFRRDLLAVFDRVEEMLPFGNVTIEERTALSGHAKDVLLGLGLIWSHETNTYMFDQEEYQGHMFYAEPLPPYDVSGGPGSLATYFPEGCTGYKCAVCGLVIGVEGPIETAERVYLGWGSFPNTTEWWPRHQCQKP